MEIKCDHPLLLLTEKQVIAVRELCGIDGKLLKEYTQIVMDWCSKEEHLQAAVPVLAKTRMIERRILLSKGSVEDCKKRIDALLTSRALMPEICLNRSVEEFKTIQNCVRYVPMPKLNPTDLSRIIVTQFRENLDEFTMLAYFRYAFFLGEYRLYDDYGISETYVLDLNNISLGILTKLNPILIKKSEILSTEGYGTKIKGIHILNAPSFVDKIVFILKQGMKPKVANRIRIHSTYDDLYEYVPKEILPEDFGGEQPSLEKLTDDWNELMSTEESRQKIKDLDTLVSDESRRSSAKFNEEYLGMPGSFRKLDVD